MPQLKTVFNILKAVATSAAASPRGTGNALKMVPPLVQGAQFAQSGRFPAPPARPAAVASASNPLLDYFNAHTEGPGLWKWLHYFDIYHRHFQRFVGQKINIVEIGIYSGGSLGMWRSYFGPQSHIYGIDVEPACISYQTEGIDVLIGDQADRNFWKEFRKKVPEIHVLIDDGGHSAEQQCVTLEEMLPHIQPGGGSICART
jgi:hypothetical protein